MKKLLLVVLWLWCSVNASAQKIHFTDTSNVWLELTFGWNDFAPVFFYYHNFSFAKDTVVDSQEYKKFDFGLVREDTIMRKVYIRNLVGDSDNVLMDYNLNVGDTFFAPYEQYPVLRIDSTLINAVWHKTWYFKGNLGGFYGYSNDTIYVIEGIGCLQHPTFMVTDFIGCVECLEPYMYCFSNNKTKPTIAPPVAFFDNAHSCVYYPILQMGNPPFIRDKIDIYPNPATTELTITASEKINKVDIFNLVGQKIFSRDFSSTQTQVNVSELQDGVYFIRINGTEVRKFVKK